MMLEKLEGLADRFDELQALLASPDLYSDPARAAQLLAGGIGTISEGGMRATAKKVAAVAAERGATVIVVGMPKNMDGSEGGSADKIRAFAELLRPLTAAEVVFLDERVTTMAAHQILNLTDTRGAKRKSVVDTLSAEIILQNYLDRSKNV